MSINSILQKPAGVLIWFENEAVSWVLVWKLGVSWVLEIQQMEAYSTKLMISSPEFLFIYIQIFLSMKFHHFLESILI